MMWEKAYLNNVWFNTYVIFEYVTHTFLITGMKWYLRYKQEVTLFLETES
jgi:hypothetical protein